MALHPRRPGEPWLGGGTGGVSGPAVRAIALAQVREVARSASRSRSSGWAASSPDATRDDLRDAGADLVAVGTESFRDPLAAGADRGRGVQAERRIPCKRGMRDRGASRA